MNAKRWRLLLGFFSAVTVSLCVIYLLRVKSEPSKMIGVVEPAPDSNKIAARPAQPVAAANESETAPPGEGGIVDPILIAQERRWASGSIGMMFGFLTSDFAKPKHRHRHPNPSPSPAPSSPPDASGDTTLVQTLSPSVNSTMELASDATQDAGTFAVAPTLFESSLPIIPLSQPNLGTIASNSPASVINQIVAPGMTTAAALTNNLVSAPLQNLVHNAQSLSGAAASASSGLLQAPTQILASQPLRSILPPSSISSLSSSLPPTTSLLSSTSLTAAGTSSLGGASSLAHTAVDSVTFPLSPITLKDPGTLTQVFAPVANSLPVISLSQRSVDTIANDQPASVITRIVHPDTTAVTTTVMNNSPNARLQNLIRDAQSLSITTTSPSSGASRAQMQSFTSRLLGSISSPSSISSSSSSHPPTASVRSAPTSSLGGAASLTHGAIHSVSSGHH
jgi:hypothetical protein